MKTIEITCTNEIIEYNDYFKPFICVSDIEMPKQYNQGWNSFRFIGGEPKFIGKNMPDIVKNETTNYIFYEVEIKIFRKDKTSISGFYLKTFNKNLNKIESEKFYFN